MKSRLVTRNVTINGHRTSLRLQTEIWDALAEICHREHMSLNDLCSLIDERCSGNNRTSAVRAFAVTYFRAAHGNDAESSPSMTLIEGDEDTASNPPLARIGRNFRDLRLELAKVHASRASREQRHRGVLRVMYRLRADVLDFLASVDETLRSADPLTGLPGRDGLFRRLERERLEVGQSDNPSCIALIGLDLADLFEKGSADANRVFSAVAGFLVDNVRQHDEIYRSDGRSLVVLMPRTGPDKAKRVLDRIRRGLARASIQLEDGRAVTVTASVGVAPIFPSDPSETTLARAETAVRLARSAGRNRVRIWNSEIGDMPFAPISRSLYSSLTPARVGEAMRSGERVKAG